MSKTYIVEDEASGAHEGYIPHLEDAIEEANEKAERAKPYGRYLVRDMEGNVVYDTNLNVSYKI